MFGLFIAQRWLHSVSSISAKGKSHNRRERVTFESKHPHQTINRSIHVLSIEGTESTAGIDSSAHVTLRLQTGKYWWQISTAIDILYSLGTEAG